MCALVQMHETVLPAQTAATTVSRGVLVTDRVMLYVIVLDIICRHSYDGEGLSRMMTRVFVDSTLCTLWELVLPKCMHGRSAEGLTCGCSAEALWCT